MKLVKVGIFPLGPHDVTVFADYKGKDGRFWGAKREIHIGLDHPQWQAVVNVTLHEAMEFALMDIRCRFDASPDYGNAHDSYVFIATHAQFTEACGRVAWLVSGLLPKLAEHYKRAQKKKR